MSNIERRNRIDELKERLFFDIKGGGGGGGGGGYGAPNIPSYNAPAPAPSYNEPLPTYGASSLPSYGGFNFNKGPGKVIEIPVPDLPIPDPIEFKAAVLRSKGRIASGLLHTKAGILRAGANILAQKANALDKFAQAIPAIKANLINSIKDTVGGIKGGGGGGYGAPPPSGGGYGAPPPQPSYNTPQGPQISSGYGVPQANPIGPTQNPPQSTYNNGNSVQPSNNNFRPSTSFNSGNSGNSFNAATYNSGSNSNSFNSGGSNSNSFNGQNSVQPINNNFRPSNEDNYGSPVGAVISNQGNNVISNNDVQTISNVGNTGNVAVSSSLSFGNNNGNSFSNNNNGNSFSNNNQNNYNSGSSSNNQNNYNTGSNSNNQNFNTGSNSNNQNFNTGSVSSVNNAVNPRQNNQISTSNGFNPLTQSTFDQASNSNPKRNVFGTVNGQVNSGQMTTITLNDLNTLRQNTEKLILQETRQQAGRQQARLQTNGFGQCQSNTILNELLQDIFMGNEVIPDIIDEAPRYPLDLTYKTIRTFPGMRLTADMTRFKPMLKWPAQPDSLYTIVLSNLDINSRRNRTLSEFWHWFVANVPGDSVDDGEVIFDLLFPLVLPEGDGDHRYGYFVFEQPGQLDYAEEGGPTDSCSPQMSNGRGPFKSTKNFMKKYNLDLTAATFLIIDSNEASMEIACEWQKCIGDTINLVSPLQCGKK